ncbi:Sensor protein CzcS precursor [Planctomycetes bacterium Poly30]|uniref:histidine kinase n=2 Tax=Saltatorellus ferox TaxID=2528018 RepID=A0A518ELJ9_9BACT|nr:Sensor protein CzcS precursor [Planctomycetes bacterium Poly30]
MMVLVAVALSVGMAGLFAARTLRARIVSEAESSLESVLRLGATRMCAEARQVNLTDRVFFSDRELSGMDEFLWLVKGSRGAPGSQGFQGAPGSAADAGVEELARSDGFPFDGLIAPLADTSFPAEPMVRFVVGQDADGQPYRMAMLAITPALDRPPTRSEDRSPGMGQRPQRGGDRGRPGAGPGRGGPGGPGGGPRFAPDEHFQIYVARSIREERAILESLLRTLLAAGAVAVGLSALIVPWTVRRGLRPVRAISKKISDVDETRLDRALEIDAIPVELAPIVQSFEGVREHLAAAFAREGRFTSNAAHELRTPLAGLRASMEVALRRQRTSDQYRATIDECLQITCSMQGMVESLLLLAKGGHPSRGAEAVDVEGCLRRAFAASAGELAEQRLTVQWGNVTDPVVSCVAALAERALSNIVANAVQYAVPGSVITVAFDEAPDELGLRLVNRCEGLAHDTAERAFEPLWRGDTVRTDASLHAGLGLSIVQQCVEAIGGSVSVCTECDRFELSLSLPR